MRRIAVAAVLAWGLAACGDPWSGVGERVPAEEYLPVVTSFLDAARMGNEDGIAEVAADSSSAEALRAFVRENTALLATDPGEDGPELIRAGWAVYGSEILDTLLVEVELPARTRPAECYYGGEQDRVQLRLIRHEAGWRIVGAGTPEC